MREQSRRDKAWNDIADEKTVWDMVVVGGGITGAGILREARRAGLKVLLVEKRDFAWGTSSRSSKLVHGGLRYLKQGHVMLTRSALLEREHLIRHSQELVTPLHFLLHTWKNRAPKRWTFALGLTLYNLIAGRWEPLSWPPDAISDQTAEMDMDKLARPLRYFDAQADDARLVLRLILEAVADGAAALNHAHAAPPERQENRLFRMNLRDQVTGQEISIRTKTVANATGAWANDLRHGDDLPVRPQRGSHLMFSAERLPLQRAAMLIHPRDGRPLFLVPWEGAVMFGTTDVDHRENLDQEARITRAEVHYLMEALETAMPQLNLTTDDIIGTWSGVRPIISQGEADPTRESRDHQIWDESGLLTITGGKLTTFRKMAFDLLKKARSYLPDLNIDRKASVYDEPGEITWPDRSDLTGSVKRRLLSRFGANAGKVAETARSDEFSVIPGTHTPWAEIRWAAGAESVVHLDDLLLRRVRIGLLLPEGGAKYMDRIGSICREELGWSMEQWREEAEQYRHIWETCYSLPP